MDPPTLDPCTNGCADASLTLDAAAPADDASGSVETGTPPPADGATADGATADGAADAAETGPINGIRCGGGTAPIIGCAGATPECCEIADDAGNVSYQCRANAGACEGYPIGCTTNTECSGSSVCCHFGSSIKCEPQSSCPNNSLVCDPNGPTDQCPSGWKCSVAFVNGGTTLPYFGCSP
jgi:hypothetical protein